MVIIALLANEKLTDFLEPSIAASLKKVIYASLINSNSKMPSLNQPLKTLKNTSIYHLIQTCPNVITP